ncbi:MAG: VTT domain-containing protein [Candidatus Thiodiazotropha sp. (ex Monitilora ramsayi)]|nr:VTT domain-containing protein [Candidatus Thiodiazotropha sp. (ex Monitilora ramsayi)]
MSELLTTLLTWIADNPFWAGVAVFLVAFSESVALFGLLIPGVVMMFGFGALIATGTLAFWPVFWWAVAGAVAGDGLSFWLGRHFQDHLREHWPFNRHPKILQRGIDFFEKYGGKSVAIGRFFGPVRAIIPLVAGMMGMKTWRFLIANLLSALAWAPAYLLPGIVFGASLELASEVALRLVILMLLLLVSSWLLFITVRRVFRLIQPHATQIVQWGFEWGQMHPGFRSISRALADPNHPEAKGLAFLATLLLVASLLFVVLTGTVLDGTLTQDLNLIVFNTLQSLRSPWGDHLMTAFSVPGDLPFFFIISCGLAAALWVRGQRRASYYLLAAILFGLLAPLLLKYTLHVPRPPAAGDSLGPWSFPSAHVLRTITLYGFFSIMVARTLLHEWRWLPYSLAALIIGAVGLSRLYLGVHWLTDVLGSLMLGTAWIALLGIAYHRHVAPISHRSLLIGSLTVLIIPAAAYALSDHAARYNSYQPENVIVSQPYHSWQQRIESDLPLYRNDIRGENDHPLNIIIAGRLNCMTDHLAPMGWETAEMLDWHNLLRLLSSRTSMKALPVLPQVHAGDHEIIVLDKNLDDDSRLLLRLWPTHTRLDPGAIPVFVGTVSSQQTALMMNLITIPRTDMDFARAQEHLLADIKTLGNLVSIDAGRIYIDLTSKETCPGPGS